MGGVRSAAHWRRSRTEPGERIAFPPLAGCTRSALSGTDGRAQDGLHRYTSLIQQLHPL